MGNEADGEVERASYKSSSDASEEEAAIDAPPPPPDDPSPAPQSTGFQNPDPSVYKVEYSESRGGTVITVPLPYDRVSEEPLGSPTEISDPPTSLLDKFTDGGKSSERAARIESHSFTPRIFANTWEDVPTFEHGFLEALHYAFAKHVPLYLRADHFWILVAQGVARHESEVLKQQQKMKPLGFLRKKANRSCSGYVGPLYGLDSERKIDITVTRDEFVRGETSSDDWEAVLPEFETLIREQLPEELAAVLTIPMDGSFYSTATSLSRCCAAITLMDTLQNYFSYVVRTRCGIPRIVLRGPASDWENLDQAVVRLLESPIGQSDEFMTQWLRSVHFVTSVLAETAAGAPPTDWLPFFRSIYTSHSASGLPTPRLTGWILAFFPYRWDGKSKYIKMAFPRDLPDSTRQAMGLVSRLGFDMKVKVWCGEVPGVPVDQIPAGMSCAPFVWRYLEKELPCKFVGGFVGCRKSSDGFAVVPALGWAVLDCSGEEI